MNFSLHYTAAAVPHTVANVSAVETVRGAVISWLVPTISYTVEQYRVEYRLAGDSNQAFKYSQSTQSGILDSNVSHSVELSGLTHNRTYHYIVVAVNCIGNSTTVQKTLMTLQDGELSMIQCVYVCVCACVCVLCYYIPCSVQFLAPVLKTVPTQHLTQQ